jgi:hypothetical protein
MRNLVITIVLAGLTLLISGCGGGGGGGTAATPQTVTGVAAAGSAIVGTVTLKDSASAPEKSFLLKADGSFTLDVTGLTKPFLLRVTGKANGTDYVLYSLATDKGTANINPLSNLVVSVAAAGGDLAQLYATPSGIQGVAGNLGQALLQVQSILKPLLVKYGVSTVDPISGSFTVGVSALDLMLDKVTLKIDAGTLSISDNGTAQAAIVVRTGFATHAVRGSVTLDGAAFAGVTVTAKDAATGTLNYGSAVSVADGSYSIANLAPGTYLLTAAVSNFGFDPASMTVTVSDADVTLPDVFNSLRPFAVSGKVTGKDSGGNPVGLAGATVSAQSGGISFGSAITDGNGNYTLGLPKGSFTVSASRKDRNNAQVVFLPASTALTISDAANHASANFASDLATFTVAGKITRRLDGSTMAGVALSLVSESSNGTLLTTDDAKFNTATDASGNYSFAGMPAGYYALTPTLTDFVFNPNGFKGSFLSILVDSTSGTFDINGVAKSELTGGLQ